jgi:hypothetical protein
MLSVIFFFPGDSTAEGLIAGIDASLWFLLGLPFGFFLGALCGLFLSWLPGVAPPKPASSGRQLVGEMCIVCRKRIGSIAEGGFCPVCGGAVHHGCIQARASDGESRCPVCGGDPSLKLRPDYHG